MAKRHGQHQAPASDDAGQAPLTDVAPPNAAPPPPEAPKRTRKPREKLVFELEKSVGTVDEGPEAGRHLEKWENIPAMSSFDSESAIFKVIQDADMEGRFRIVAVRKTFTAAKVAKLHIS